MLVMDGILALFLPGECVVYFHTERNAFSKKTTCIFQEEENVFSKRKNVEFYNGFKNVISTLPFRECVMYVHDYSYLWPILFSIFSPETRTYMSYIVNPHLSRISKLFKCTFNFTIDHENNLQPTQAESYSTSYLLSTVLRSCLSLFFIFNFSFESCFSAGLLQGHRWVLLWGEEPVQKLLEEMRWAPRILQVQ